MKLMFIGPVVALTLTGCVTSSGGYLAPDESPQSAYGPFLAGRYAGNSRDLDDAARLYGKALSVEPHSVYLSERTFYAALMDGQFELATQAAEQAATDPQGYGLSGLYLKAAHIKTADRYQSIPDYNINSLGAFGVLFDDLLTQWFLMAQGKSDDALIGSQELEIPNGTSDYVRIHQALLFDAAGEARAAEDAYRSALATSSLQSYITVLFGHFLERERRKDEAISLYQSQMARGNDGGDVRYALERAQSSRRRPERWTSSEYAARALFPLSAILANQTTADFSALYLRVVENLDPNLAHNTFFLAEILERLEMDDAALAAYDRASDGPFSETALISAAWLSYRMGDTEAAYARAERLAETGSLQPRLLQADILRFNQDYAGAKALYEDVIARAAQQGLAQDWRWHFFLGICEQQLGDWPAAEAQFLSALEIEPDNARVLNHLGYNWMILDHDIEAGLAMVERAAELDPDNGSIIDSVGWGYYLLERYDDAVSTLERAAQLRPSSATILFHLGDAYWQVGRFTEARHQWEHALNLEPSADQRAELERRLARSLPTNEI